MWNSRHCHCSACHRKLRWPSSIEKNPLPRARVMFFLSCRNNNTKKTSSLFDTTDFSLRRLFTNAKIETECFIPLDKSPQSYILITYLNPTSPPKITNTLNLGTNWSVDIVSLFFSFFIWLSVTLWNVTWEYMQKMKWGCRVDHLLSQDKPLQMYHLVLDGVRCNNDPSPMSSCPPVQCSALPIGSVRAHGWKGWVIHTVVSLLYSKREEISPVLSAGLQESMLQRCAFLSALLFLDFDNVRLNIDAQKLLQRSHGGRSGEFYFGKIQKK